MPTPEIPDEAKLKRLERLHKHKKIEEIWRKVYGYGERTYLSGSDKEWEFMRALLDYRGDI